MGEMNESLMTFPCDFPLKVIGQDDNNFDSVVMTIVRKHCQDVTDNHVSARPSKQGKYLALTVNIVAQSQMQLDALYSELSGHKQVMMVL